MPLVSPDLRVLLRPRSTFRALAARPLAERRWLAWRRPMFFALLLGCAMSLTTTGSLTMRLVASTALSWSFIPILEVAALALVVRGPDERRRFSSVVDRFCLGLTGWSLWLVGTALLFSVAPPSFQFQFFWIWLDVVGVVVLGWSVYVDYCFFVEILGRDGPGARRGLLLHRLLTWIAIVLIIDQPAILPTLLYFAGR